MSDTDDPSLLVLVLDDPRAPVILAWWKSNTPGRSLVSVGKKAPRARDRVSSDDLAQLCRLTYASPEEVCSTIDACETAQLFDAVTGGITDTAGRWLTDRLASKLVTLRTRRQASAQAQATPISGPPPRRG